MRQIKTVMMFEFMSFVKSGIFIGMAIFMMLVALIGPVAPSVFRLFQTAGFVGGERTIAVVDPYGIADGLDFEEFLAPSVVLFQNLYEARTAVGDGTHNYAVEITPTGYTLYVTAMGIGIMNLEHQISGMLHHIYRVEILSQIGATPQQTESIMNPDIYGEIMTIAPDGTRTEDAALNYLQNITYFYVMGLMLYMGILMGGQYLVTSVIREKSTKTMEILITSCRAINLLNGKVMGVGLAIFIKIALVIGAALVSMQIAGFINVAMMIGAGEDIFVVDVPYDVLAYMVIFFILGFVMYSYLYAALASTVSRMEDANSIVGIPTFIIVGGFLGGVFGMNNPGADWVFVLSHIPFFAPFVMFMRICLGLAATWEIVVSILAQIGTVLLMSWLGGRIYRMGTLMYGNKPKLKDLWVGITTR